MEDLMINTHVKCLQASGLRPQAPGFTMASFPTRVHVVSKRFHNDVLPLGTADERYH
jgi:hypothetical protein